MYLDGDEFAWRVAAWHSLALRGRWICCSLREAAHLSGIGREVQELDLPSICRGFRLSCAYLSTWTCATVLPGLPEAEDWRTMGNNRHRGLAQEGCS